MADDFEWMLSEAARGRDLPIDAEQIWQAGRRRRTRRIGLICVAVLMPLALVVATATATLPQRRIELTPADAPPTATARPTTPSPKDRTATRESCRSGPRLQIRPTSGPPGTRVSIRGTCFTGASSTARKALAGYGLFLIGLVEADERSPGAPAQPCEIIGGGESDLRVHNGRAEGFLTVPARGGCFQEPRSERLVPGTYTLGMGCHACSTNATFRVTRPVAVPTIPQLPPQGLAVEVRDGVRLLDLDGGHLVTLKEWHTDGSWSAGMPPVLEDPNGRPYRLDAAARRLTPIELDSHSNDIARELDMEKPRYDGRAARGSWRWILPSPDGSKILGQWSGECEVQTAFLLDGEGRHPEPVVGATYADAPQSVGLGWSGSGFPVVHLPQGACGSSAEVPGIYEGTTPLRLIVKLPTFAFVQMWDTR